MISIQLNKTLECRNKSKNHIEAKDRVKQRQQQKPVAGAAEEAAAATEAAAAATTAAAWAPFISIGAVQCASVSWQSRCCRYRKHTHTCTYAHREKCAHIFELSCRLVNCQLNSVFKLSKNGYCLLKRKHLHIFKRAVS